MRGRLLFVIGAAAGYVIGARHGREAYDKIADRAAEVWTSPRAQKVVDGAADLVRDRVPFVGGALASAIERGSDRIDETVDEATDAHDDHADHADHIEGTEHPEGTSKRADRSTSNGRDDD